MVFSKYISIIHITDKSSIAYSAVTNMFVVFDNKLEHLFHCDVECLKAENLGFYKNLEAGGFLVEDADKEAEEVIHKGMEYCESTDNYHLTINPTLNCNFRCWYCYEDHNGNTKMSKGTVSALNQLIDRLICDEKLKILNFSFFGGEPLLYFNDIVRPIIENIRRTDEGSKHVNLHFTTNAYLLNDAIMDFLSKGKEEVSFQITLDGGRSDHNKVRVAHSQDGSYDTIVRNVKRIANSSMHVTLRINYTHSNIKSVCDIPNDFMDLPAYRRKRIRVDFQRVWQDNEINNQSKELKDAIEKFRECSFTVTDEYIRINTYRHPCYGDKENSCIVNYNGDVFKCTARDFSSKCRAGILTKDGHIEWKATDYTLSRTRNRFKRSTCRNCRILPLCGGGCSQRATEAIGDFCINNFSEQDKDMIVMERMKKA